MFIDRHFGQAGRVDADHQRPVPALECPTAPDRQEQVHLALGALGGLVLILTGVALGSGMLRGRAAAAEAPAR